MQPFFDLFTPRYGHDVDLERLFFNPQYTLSGTKHGIGLGPVIALNPDMAINSGPKLGGANGFYRFFPKGSANKFNFHLRYDLIWTFDKWSSSVDYLSFKGRMNGLYNHAGAGLLMNLQKGWYLDAGAAWGWTYWKTRVDGDPDDYDLIYPKDTSSLLLRFAVGYQFGQNVVYYPERRRKKKAT